MQDLTLQRSDAGSVSLKWTHPQSGDMAITLFRIWYAESNNLVASKTDIVYGTATSHVITALHPYTEYTIKIMAISALGNGFWSAPIKAQTGQAGKFVSAS